MYWSKLFVFAVFFIMTALPFTPQLSASTSVGSKEIAKENNLADRHGRYWGGRGYWGGYRNNYYYGRGYYYGYPSYYYNYYPYYYSSYSSYPYYYNSYPYYYYDYYPGIYFQVGW